MTFSNKLHKIINGQNEPFAIIHRPETVGPGKLEVLFGDVSELQYLSQIPLRDGGHNDSAPSHDAFVFIPYKQLAERGFEAVDDGCPILALSVSQHEIVQIKDIRAVLPKEEICLDHAGFDHDDAAYTEIIRDILNKEIRSGEGSNFVIKRSFTAELSDYSTKQALSLFRSLLDLEVGAYWSFIFHTGSQTFVGATPERHISLSQNIAVMNPISGTFRYPKHGLELDDLRTFLVDQKETEELYMVLDEELKMMARICDGGGQVVGPSLRGMSQLVHTEYYIKGFTRKDLRDVLRETLFAPTVTGSPLENACRIIARYEPGGRRYYGGVAALFGCEGKNEKTLDSAILIRTANFIQNSRKPDQHVMDIGVGTTLVRHSSATSEVQETHAKLAGILNAIKKISHAESADAPQIMRHDAIFKNIFVKKALANRNTNIADFWLKTPVERKSGHSRFFRKTILLIDAEDNFSSMLAIQLEALGFVVDLVTHNAVTTLNKHDLVVLGPGPGDPSDLSDDRMVKMTGFTEELLRNQQPFLSVCLSHQLLCKKLGLTVRRRPQPNQGIQKCIDAFGQSWMVGFYNSFAAYDEPESQISRFYEVFEIFKDSQTHEVHAIMGRNFASMQFHIESVLTKNAPAILESILDSILFPVKPIRKALES